MSDNYIPEEGDIIWISFQPVRGREQGKRRPAIVISPMVFNRTGLCIVCPITSKIKKHRTEVFVEIKDHIKGVILTNHLKSLDWKSRNAAFITKATQQTLVQVKIRLALLLGVDQGIVSLIESD